MSEYVQLLTVVPEKINNTPGKILLCKWLKGEFENRYTGLWGRFNQGSDADHKSALIRLAKENESSGYPILDGTVDIELVAKLKFDVPEENWEFIYLRKLDRVPGIKSGSAGDQNFICEGFDFDRIPFHQMPADDEFWYPGVLDGKKYTGEFRFAGEPKRTIKYQKLEEVFSFNDDFGKE